MKAIREYQTKGNYLYCSVRFVPETEDEAFSDDTWNVYQFPLQFSFLTRYPSKSITDCLRFSVKSHPNLSPLLVAQESIRFLSVIQQMYDLK